MRLQHVLLTAAALLQLSVAPHAAVSTPPPGASSSPLAAFTVTVFQPASYSLTANVSEQLAALRVALAAASAAGSNLLVCPELYAQGYGLSAPFAAESARRLQNCLKALLKR